MPGKHKKHTPLTSRAQQKFFGRELSEKKGGDGSRTDMSITEIERHLDESRGKRLKARARRYE